VTGVSGLVLAASYALHMMATAVWIGGLFYLVVLLPIPLRRMPQEEGRGVLRHSIRRFLPLAWLAAVAFTVTGLTQMSASPMYQGFLEIHNVWSAVILTKHIVIAGMVVLLAWETWVVAPEFDRLALGLSSRPSDSLDGLWRSERRGLTVSLLLGGIVLVLTAIARSSV
jgi:uncharacterized membrane protein